jgi:hypothetical protein
MLTVGEIRRATEGLPDPRPPDPLLAEWRRRRKARGLTALLNFPGEINDHVDSQD